MKYTITLALPDMRQVIFLIPAMISAAVSNQVVSFLVRDVIPMSFRSDIFQRQSSAVLQNSEMYQDFDPFSSDTESDFVAGLRKRVDTLSMALDVETCYGEGEAVVDLPVICFDALLPGQKMQGSTTDPTFCEILKSLGLGGSFVMTSLNTKQRKLRRYATVVKIELVDVEPNKDFSPTSVTFIVAGHRRCEILGAANGMKTRVGRWRRDYDPDGEETRLGWGEERFADVEDSRIRNDLNITLSESYVVNNMAKNEWGTNKILVIDEEKEDDNATIAAIDKAASLMPLIEQWFLLASNPKTFDNIDVVASTRIQRGEPGLRLNPKTLMQKVRMDLGPMPPPTKPTALAIWGAALINPLPALGVSTEIRGAILHVDGAAAKLDVLERGLVRSIKNLKGITPL